MYEVAMSSRGDRARRNDASLYSTAPQEYLADSDEQLFDEQTSLGFVPTIMKVAIACFLMMLLFGAYQIVIPNGTKLQVAKVEQFNSERLGPIKVPQNDDYLVSIRREFASIPNIDYTTTGSISKSGFDENKNASIRQIIESSSGVHVVIPGDTLSGIGITYGITQATLMELNNIKDPKSLKPGMTLLLGRAK